jgi:hypothetical protein
MTVAASKLAVFNDQADVVLLSGKMRTSNPADLTFSVTLECSILTAVANDAPATPQPERPEPAAPEPPVVYVPEPPPPANEVAVDYMRTLMANAAQELAAPEQAAAPGPTPAEPIQAIDPKSFERSLREARL